MTAQACITDAPGRGQKDTRLAAALQLAHNSDQLGGVGGRQSAALLQDGRQLSVGDVADVQLQETRAERS